MVFWIKALLSILNNILNFCFTEVKSAIEFQEARLDRFKRDQDSSKCLEPLKELAFLYEKVNDNANRQVVLEKQLEILIKLQKYDDSYNVVTTLLGMDGGNIKVIST